MPQISRADKRLDYMREYDMDQEEFTQYSKDLFEHICLELGCFVRDNLIIVHLKDLENEKNTKYVLDIFNDSRMFFDIREYNSIIIRDCKVYAFIFRIARYLGYEYRLHIVKLPVGQGSLRTYHIHIK